MTDKKPDSRMPSTPEVLDLSPGQKAAIQDENAEVAAFLAELIAVSTHDLRSPLGAIGIFCELLQMPDMPTDEQSRSIGLMQEATAKAQRILDDLSEYSRIMRGILKPARSPVDLRECWEEAVSRVSPDLHARNVALDVSFDPGSYQTVCDRPRMNEVVLSIVENASAGLPAGERVTAHGMIDGQSGQIVLSVLSPAQRLIPEEKQSVKGRLGGGNRPGQSRYTLGISARLTALMGGQLTVCAGEKFQAVMRMPVLSAAEQPKT